MGRGTPPRQTLWVPACAEVGGTAEAIGAAVPCRQTIEAPVGACFRSNGSTKLSRLSCQPSCLLPHGVGPSAAVATPAPAPLPFPARIAYASILHHTHAAPRPHIQKSSSHSTTARNTEVNTPTTNHTTPSTSRGKEELGTRGQDRTGKTKGISMLPPGAGGRRARRGEPAAPRRPAGPGRQSEGRHMYETARESE